MLKLFMIFFSHFLITFFIIVKLQLILKISYAGFAYFKMECLGQQYLYKQ